MPDHPARPVGRRRLLAGAVGAAGALLTGCSVGLPRPQAPRPDASCVPRTSLDTQREVAGLSLVYEIGQRPSAFRFEPAFYRQLGEWAAALPAALDGRPDQLWTYGSWTDGGGTCDSWHNAGRAFDVSRVRLRGGEFVSCRYDRWRTETGAALAARQRAYWRLAASLHLRFAYVLTYLYDAVHANHIHVDNGRSGPDWSTFSTRSRVQVQAVQAILTHVWDRPVEITDRWDAPTRAATAEVLAAAGLPADLSATAAWPGFLTASAERAAD